MSFDYETINVKKHSSGTQWAAYSDLFMVLAFVFLLMYMVSSLRNGMASISTHAEIVKAQKELEIYETVKNDYLRMEASAEEQKMYQEILTHISLLEEDASKRKEQLAQEYNAQKNREQSLNQYQQMILSMMNANTIAKAEAIETIKSEQDANRELSREVARKQTDIAMLKEDIKLEAEEVSALKSKYTENALDYEQRVRNLKSQREEDRQNLASLEERLKLEAERKERLKRVHTAETQRLENKLQNLLTKHYEDKEKISSLATKLRNEAAEMDSLRGLHSRERQDLKHKIHELSDRHDRSQQELVQLEDRMRKEALENQRLKISLTKETNDLEDRLGELKREHDRSLQNVAVLEKNLESKGAETDNLKSTYAQEQRDLKNKIEDLKFKNQKSQNNIESLEDLLKAKESERDALKDAYADAKKLMNEELADLKDKHADSQKKLADLYNANKDEVERLNSDLQTAKKGLEDKEKDLRDKEKDLALTKANLADTSKNLDDALKMAQRRKDIAKRIKDNFNKHGINADVDGDTGDVILDFGNNYFETDSHTLKPGMESVIRKAIPVYAKSLFGNQSLSPLITSVEIIGFASPTYAGKPVDPTTLSASNRIAVNYNLDLSYRRARSIFEYVFDTNKINFTYQNRMVHLINVTGRSFFSERIDPKDTGGLTIEEFCGQYNCMKSQRVIIKFGLSNKNKGDSI